MHGQRLFLWQAWLEAKSGNVEQVHTALQADYQFWKTVLANTHSLITKMISMATVKHHFILGTAIINQLPADQQLDAIPDGWDVAFSDNELGLELALAGEWHFGSDITSTIRNTVPSEFGSDVNTIDTVFYLFVQPLMLVEDTKNIHATQLLQLQQDKDHQPTSAPWYSWLRNPLGKIFMATGTAHYKDYQQRLLKLEQERQDVLQNLNLAG